MKFEFEVINKKDFSDEHRHILAEMLNKQGKVQGNFDRKIDNCKLLCIAKVNNQPIAIGAIKEKTQSDFDSQKAALPELANEFDWELGYLYTEKDYEGLGIASSIVKKLILVYGNDNLMATTEISANPGMVKILERNGFHQYGKPWKSEIHDNYLGLYLKLK